MRLVLQISIPSSNPDKQVNATHSHPPPKKISFLPSLYFCLNENSRVFFQENYHQSVPDFTGVKQVVRATVSQTQMLHINRCKILLCPTWNWDLLFFLKTQE